MPYVSKKTAVTLQAVATQQIARALGVLVDADKVTALGDRGLEVETTIGPMYVHLVEPMQISPRKWSQGWLAVRFNNVQAANEAARCGVLEAARLNPYSGKYNAMNLADIAHHLKLFRAIAQG